MSTEWLDLMPAIPLARGVPFIELAGIGTHDLNVSGVCVEALPAAAHVAFPSGDEAIDEDDPRWLRLRVDLDDPQGFRYAATWIARLSLMGLARVLSRSKGNAIVTRQSARRWLADRVLGLVETTDADRLTVAQALREVTR